MVNKQTYATIFKEKNSYNSDINCDNYKYVINELLKINTFNSLFDIGSGRGNLISSIRKIFPNIKISTSDIQKFHDFDEVFYQIDLYDVSTLNQIDKHDIITCTDVLEHIEEKYINNILKKISEKCEIAIFTIANHSDIINGVELHLIQKDEKFWTEILSQHFKIKNLEIAYNNRLYLITCTV